MGECADGYRGGAFVLWGVMWCIFSWLTFVFKVRKEMIPMKLDEHTRGLIAVGASIAANCQPCLQTAVTMACKSGADEQEIAEAIEIGRMVRKGAASKMDKFLSSLENMVATVPAGTESGCGCGS